MSEAYVTMFYGPTRTPSLSGLFVLLDSLRWHDSQREVAILRLHEDQRSAALEHACRRFAPCRTRDVPRLVLSPAVHPECARHLRDWARPNGSAASNKELPTDTPAGHARRKRKPTVEGEMRGKGRNEWWAQYGAKIVPLGLRSIFTAFSAWSLTEYRRIVWLESDQVILAPLGTL